MKFSIIIPVYNTAAYLPECLDSVLSQNEDIELICINDGSTDNSLDILEQYVECNSQIKIINQKNCGQGSARNIGIQMSTGDYLFFLDSDDIIRPNFFFNLNRAIEDCNPDVIAFNSALWYSEEDNREVYNSSFNHKELVVYNRGMDYIDYFVSTRKWGPTAICFYLFKRTLIQQNRILFEKGLLHEDDLYIPQALSYAGNVVTLPCTIYIYRMRAESSQHSVKEKNYRDKIKIAHQLYKFFALQSKQNKTTDRIIYNLCLAGVIGLIRTSKAVPQEDKELLWKTAHTLKEKIKTTQWLLGLKR